jgi:hypothetical protein
VKAAAAAAQVVLLLCDAAKFGALWPQLLLPCWAKF